ncbi:MAG TPA: trigger factor [Steroidobacteraceae bacterium]|nr:trigger factor [Steroidobacteraceae bacterium]
MMVSVETLAGLERRLQVSVPATRVQQQMDARLLKVSRTVRIKGFRPGKAPIHVVRKHYGPQVREEVVSDLIRETFAEALRQEKLQPAGGPRIEPLKSDQKDDLRYTATFEVYPQFELGSLATLRLTRPTAVVTDGDLEAMIESLRKQRPDWTEVSRGCQDGDRITLDFEGKIDGEAFEGNRSENLSIVLGTGRLLPDFENGVRSAAAGESRDFDLRFPDEYPARSVAGKTARFHATVHKVEESHLPAVDDRFCEAFGVTEGGIGALRAEVRDNMERELAQAITARIKSQVMEQLLAANPIAVPKALVEAEIRDMQMELLRRSGSRDARQLPPRENFEQPARRRVALGLILNEVIRQAGIKPDAAQVQSRLDEIVVGYSDPEEARRQYLQNEAATRQLQMSVLEDQAVAWVASVAQVTDQPGSFKDIMNFGADEASEE